MPNAIDTLTQSSTTVSPFDQIKRIDAKGDHWIAREMQPFLAYTQWRNMATVVGKAMAACKNNGHRPEDHFAEISNMIEVGKGATRSVQDYRLSRYACYLVAMNGDPTKPEVAAAQNYFVVSTRANEVKAGSPTLSTNPLEAAKIVTAQLLVALEGACAAQKEAAAAKQVADEARTVADRAEAKVDKVLERTEGELTLYDFLRRNKIKLSGKAYRDFAQAIGRDAAERGVKVHVHYRQGSQFSTNVYPVTFLATWEARLRQESDGAKLALFA